LRVRRLLSKRKQQKSKDEDGCISFSSARFDPLDTTSGVNVPEVELFGCERNGVRMESIKVQNIPALGMWLPAGAAVGKW